MTERAARRRTGPVLFLILCVLFLSACQTAEGMKAPEESPEVIVPSMAPLPAPEGIRIAVASDLHLDPDHATRSGELSGVSLNPELVEALLRDARHQGAELILLTGDLVNGGKDYRHEALTERLRKAEAEGLTVCVVPGNHDLAPIGQREFAELYDEFGYAEAYSRDVSSLSYCVLWKNLMILMWMNPLKLTKRIMMRFLHRFLENGYMRMMTWIPCTLRFILRMVCITTNWRT